MPLTSPTGACPRQRCVGIADTTQMPAVVTPSETKVSERAAAYCRFRSRTEYSVRWASPHPPTVLLSVAFHVPSPYPRACSAICTHLLLSSSPHNALFRVSVSFLRNRGQVRNELFGRIAGLWRNSTRSAERRTSMLVRQAPAAERWHPRLSFVKTAANVHPAMIRREKLASSRELFHFPTK